MLDPRPISPTLLAGCAEVSARYATFYITFTAERGAANASGDTNYCVAGSTRAACSNSHESFPKQLNAALLHHVFKKTADASRNGSARQFAERRRKDNQWPCEKRQKMLTADFILVLENLIQLRREQKLLFCCKNELLWSDNEELY
ncbi:hypothetical protein EYF80_022582 [Liparis tanakae]|uniref:Uncharacterized protein n=1 Tax=Liparis tanakae TaxID=230148 RepID=A0A4Z2HPI4_9TELE|nr:hypothetical protein EYF80_022582 [Liparis tanakae]